MSDPTFTQVIHIAGFAFAVIEVFGETAAGVGAQVTNGVPIRFSKTVLRLVAIEERGNGIHTVPIEGLHRRAQIPCVQGRNWVEHCCRCHEQQ